MVREAGVSAEQPIMQVDNKDIAVMFDSPHLLKNARNAIYKHNAVFNKKNRILRPFEASLRCRHRIHVTFGSQVALQIH